MINPRWLVATATVMVAAVLATSAGASTVRDRAGIFSPEAVEKAQAQLDRIERTTHIPVVIETIQRVPGLDRNASHEERREAINALAVRRDNALKDEGIYYLISKEDRLNSNLLVRERFASLFTAAKRERIGRAFLEGFKKKDFDGGLMHGVQAIEQALEGASIGHKAAQAPRGLPLAANHRGGGQSMLGTFLLIIVGIFGVLLVLRLLGGLFGRSAGAGYPNQMGGMGMPRPGMGPGGYGAPGYGGGGGFFSGMLGGLGGALAGNWLYDQFSGRHGGMNSSEVMHSGDYGSGIPGQGGDAIVGADDNPAGGGSWDDAGTTDTGGGDWGGGGGDWGGGGGGDWGGGGGDWGGGGGGGDW